MTVQKYINSLKYKLKKRTICFLIKKNKILFGKKKQGFGRGFYIGIGGKNENGELIVDTVKREMKEEINVIPTRFIQVAVNNCYYPFAQEPKYSDQQIYAYFAYEWTGIPKETNEIAPKWFNLNQIPYSLTWPDYSLWLPKVLKKQNLVNHFLYDKNNTLLDYEIEYIN